MKNSNLVHTKNVPTPETPRQKLRRHMKAHGSLYDPRSLLDKFAVKMDEFQNGKSDDKFFVDHLKVAFALGLDTHNPASESVREEYRHFLVEMIKRIEFEYDCKNAVEKALAETIALSHIRVIMFTKSFSSYMTGDLIPTKEMTDYFNLIGKELDRAQRQFNNSILTLKQIKTPSPPFNLSAKTTFIAQNQQINYGKTDKINDRQ